MPTVTYVEINGTRHTVEAENDLSLMEVALNSSVPGIDGDCGGAAACGTCHIYIDAAWIDKTGPAADGIEKDMLEFAEHSNESSRLACQVKLSEELNGLVVHLPLAQH
uniref:Ferredoxin 1 n=1 Tax=Sphingopyxis macrogoltabida TaxID=33050 RepID=Q5F4E0_SPHMC|nr:ferredoxin 1 [Sphingopyxis macrogoltabida]